MPRFFITASNIFGGLAYLNSHDVEHLRVLRIRKGEIFTVCDSNGTDYTCRLNENDPSGMSVEIISSSPSDGEPSVNCTVYTAFSKGDKIDTVIQKCVELGACGIVVFPSARCISKPNEAALIKKLNRWQKIAAEAAKQSGRGIIPHISAASTYHDAVLSASKSDAALFLYENEKDTGIRSILNNIPEFRSISLMTGPEGGFEPAEAAEAVNSGLISASLGTRILRCETAPIAALSAIMCLTGNLGK